jgi:3-oxoadipate enol-lactonase
MESARGSSPTVDRRQIEVEMGELEVTIGRSAAADGPILFAAHPAGDFGEAAIHLLQDVAGVPAVCANPRGIGASTPPPAGRACTLAEVVDDLEAVRRRLGLPALVFWGMSGGGWLGQLYARTYPEALVGLILESVCPCFRARLADPDCVLSPFHPSWRETLAEAGLIAPDSHAEVGDPALTEWTDVPGVGAVFRRRQGPALLVSPMALSPEMRAAMPVLWTVDGRAWLRDLRTPTLVLCGTADPVVPLAHARALHEAIDGAELVMVEGGGHVPAAERRPEVARAIRRFLGDRVRS